MPAIRGWQRIGLPGSAKLAERFTNAEMLGFCPGQRSRVTVLDVDSDDERVLADALLRQGKTPLVIRTASGKFHAYYKHNGERRLIRPWPDAPIDVLGGGFVVAPPSVAPSRDRYQIIEGKLDDIPNLPVMRGVDISRVDEIVVTRTKEGDRSDQLFKYCLRAVKRAEDGEELLAMASRENATYLPPLGDTEVMGRRLGSVKPRAGTGSGVAAWSA